MSGLGKQAPEVSPEQRQYALNAAMYHLIRAGMWDELAQLFATASFIAERSRQTDFADVYGDALAAARWNAISAEWQESFSTWEQFLRRRIERLRSVPEAYAQEVVNEFLPVAPEIFAARLAQLRDHLRESPQMYLKKVSGPLALGTVQTGIVYGIAFSRDQRLVICGSDDRALKIWDAETGELQAECVGHTDIVRCVAFSPDGKLAASGGHDRTVKVWDASTGRLIATCKGHRGWISSVAFSQDGRRVASGDTAVMVWEAETGRLVAEMAGHNKPVMDLDFSADGGLLASVGKDGMARVWETTSGRLVAERAGYSDVCFFHDGKRLASSGGGGAVQVWDATSGQLVAECNAGDNRIASIAVSPDDELIAAASQDAAVKIWAAASGQLVGERRGHEEPILAVSFAGDGTLAANTISALYTVPAQAAIVGETAEDRVIRVWDSSSARLVAECGGQQGRVLGVLFSEDGRSLVSFTDRQVVSVWSMPSGRLIGDFRGLDAQVTCVAVSRDGGRVAAGGDDGGVMAWSVPAGQTTGDCRGLGARVTCVAVSPDGGWVAAGSDVGLVMVWDASTGREVCRCAGHTAPVTGVAFSPDGQTIASGSDDSSVKEWRADTGELVTDWRSPQIGPVRSVEFGPDGITAVCQRPAGSTVAQTTFPGGQYPLTLVATSVNPARQVATSPDGTLTAASDMLLEAWASRRPMPLTVGDDRAYSIRAVAFSADGRRVAWGLGDVTVLDRVAGRALPTCVGHQSSVTALAFAPDGRTLASGSDDHTVRLWDTDAGTCLAELPVADESPAALAFSPDGSLLAAGSTEGAVRAWDASTGQPLFEDTDTMSYVSDITFTPNGKLVIASGSTVLGWLVETGKVAGRLPGGDDESALTAYPLMVLGMFDINLSRVDLGPLRQRPVPEPER